ncbi:hypothetical protein RUM44_009073 [Polyplax serrata]|uniref:Immunoglobulin domain-containing protein n=1 Tax=Polyplax serrata TaxID=468196 RepID=A0ABR1ARN5_POLSC
MDDKFLINVQLFTRSHLDFIYGTNCWLGLTLLGFYLSIPKVAWLRVDTQTILTIANHVITKNHRIGVTHRDRRTWFLHIKEVRESDRGWYMCQINTDPMKSQVGYIEIVGEYELSL